MPDPLARLKDATKAFGDGQRAVTAVSGASAEIRAGERIALVGPSGSGKSTLLHLLAGLDEPTSGTVEWPAIGRRDQLRPGPVAVAFQGPSLLPPLTVIENVELPLLLSGSPEEEARSAATAALQRFDVSDVADKLPEEISGGQSQRAGMARAVVGYPVLLLADEPTGQLDGASAVRVMDALLSWAQGTGTALLVATHDLAVAGRLPTRWAMEGGRLRTEVPLRSV